MNSRTHIRVAATLAALACLASLRPVRAQADTDWALFLQEVRAFEPETSDEREAFVRAMLERLPKFMKKYPEATESIFAAHYLATFQLRGSADPDKAAKSMAWIDRHPKKAGMPLQDRLEFARFEVQIEMEREDLDAALAKLARLKTAPEFKGLSEHDRVGLAELELQAAISGFRGDEALKVLAAMKRELGGHDPDEIRGIRASAVAYMAGAGLAGAARTEFGRYRKQYGRTHATQVNQLHSTLIMRLADSGLVDEAKRELQELRQADPQALPDIDEQLRVLERTKIGAVVPGLSGAGLDGTAFDIHKLRGKVVLIDFWATWCGPCRAAMPHLKRLYADFRARGLELVGVSIDEEREPVVQFVGKERLPWPIIHDNAAGADSLATRFGVEAIPLVILVDRNGVIRFRGRGKTAIDHWIDKLIKEPGKR